jgi:hypothetical protein
MRRFKVLFLCVLGASALSAVAVPSASAETRDLPQIGHCNKKAIAGGGGWSNATCTSSVPTGAKYEWVPLPKGGGHLGFTTSARNKVSSTVKTCERAAGDEQVATADREKAEHKRTEASNDINDAKILEEDARLLYAEATRLREEGRIQEAEEKERQAGLDLAIASSLREQAAERIKEAGELEKEAKELNEKAEKIRNRIHKTKQECTKLEEEQTLDEPVKLETTTGQRIECEKLAGTGNYTGPETVGDVVVTFGGCETEVAEAQVACNSPLASAGEIRPAALYGKLGVIERIPGHEVSNQIGISLATLMGEPVATIECGKELTVIVTGAVIHEVVTNKMIASETEKFIQKTGHQQPEEFENGKRESLEAEILYSGRFVGKPQAGMGLLSKLSNEDLTDGSKEKLEVDAVATAVEV